MNIKNIHPNVATIDEYIDTFPPDIQCLLNELRAFIKAEVPEATEKISYGMPTFFLFGNLVHFAAFKDHYSLFPAPSGIEQFIDELRDYRTGKGTLSFPFDKPIPWELIRKVVKFRKEENLNKKFNSEPLSKLSI
jgi:uncharacterized protein YdhG (YjbR/CyaY superfamily)